MTSKMTSLILKKRELGIMLPICLGLRINFSKNNSDIRLRILSCGVHTCCRAADKPKVNGRRPVLSIEVFRFLHQVIPPANAAPFIIQGTALCLSVRF